jgi:hypothetical protein
VGESVLGCLKSTCSFGGEPRLESKVDLCSDRKSESSGMKEEEEDAGEECPDSERKAFPGNLGKNF